MSEPTRIQAAIRQRRPFRSKGQEAAIGMMRTVDIMRRRFASLLEPRGITLQQYNVLRILRGASPEPLPTLEVADRLIEQTPGVTRLLDRLEAKGLVRRARCKEDRRQVHCWITPEGLGLLQDLDPVVDAEDDRLFEGLSRSEQAQLVRLLERLLVKLT